MGAARLERQSVSLLALIDPYIPGGGLNREDCWQRDLVSFSSVILPGASFEAFESNEEGKKEPSEEEIAIKLERSMTSSDINGREGYAALGSTALARIFCVARYLKLLSQQLDSLHH